MNERNALTTAILLGTQSLFEDGLDLPGIDLSGLVVKRLSPCIQDWHVRNIPIIVLLEEIWLLSRHSNIQVNYNEMDRRTILRIELNRAPVVSS